MASLKAQLERVTKEWEADKAARQVAEQDALSRRYQELMTLYLDIVKASGSAVGLYNDISRILSQLEAVERNLANAGLLRPSRFVVEVLSLRLSMTLLTLGFCAANSCRTRSACRWSTSTSYLTPGSILLFAWNRNYILCYTTSNLHFQYVSGRSRISRRPRRRGMSSTPGSRRSAAL